MLFYVRMPLLKCTGCETALTPVCFNDTALKVFQVKLKFLSWSNPLVWKAQISPVSIMNGHLWHVGTMITIKSKQNRSVLIHGVTAKPPSMVIFTYRISMNINDPILFFRGLTFFWPRYSPPYRWWYRRFQCYCIDML